MSRENSRDKNTDRSNQRRKDQSLDRFSSNEKHPIINAIKSMSNSDKSNKLNHQLYNLTSYSDKSYKYNKTDTFNESINQRLNEREQGNAMHDDQFITTNNSVNNSVNNSFNDFKQNLRKKSSEELIDSKN